MPEADPPLVENCHPVGDVATSAVRLRRLSEFSRGDFFGKMRRAP